MKKSNGILFPIIFSSIFVFTACGGGAGGPDTTTDTDGDGLTDFDETNLYRTNPDVTDTDGDGYSDYEEIINKNFDASNSNYRFNPLIADVPKLDVSIGVPNFSVTYSTSTSTDNSYSTGYENTVSTDSSQTNGGSSSHSIARSFSAEISTEVEVSLSPSVKAGLKLTSGFVDTESDETNYSSTLQQHNGETYSSLQNLTNTSGTTIDSAAMALFVSVDNLGHVAYTLNDLSLSVSMAGDNASGYGIPIGTLTRSAGSGTIPLAVGGTATNEVYTLQMNLQNYDTLIQNYSDLVITPVVGENNLGSDSSETNWVNLSDDVAARTATISIDYGYAREPETYRVATALDINSQSLTLGNILTDILKLPYSVQNDDLIPAGETVAQASSSLASVRGISMDIANSEMWFVAHEHVDASGVGTVTDIYTPSVIQDVENLVIKAGDGVRFVYVKDSDLDKLSDREEFILGSDHNNSDTDGDTIPDGDEVNGYAASDGTIYTSNPTLTDSDADGLSDFEEIAYSTDPVNADTDGDGGSDWFEVTVVGNSPTADNSADYTADSDGDKLTDIEEQYITLTDAAKADTDGDGLSDSFELGRVSNIFSAANPVVADCVSTYNVAIVALGNPVYDIYKLDAASTSQCDPLKADTDGDGVNDGAELTGWKPGFPAGSTIMIPSNPFVKDTDADGLNDNAERAKKGNPLSIDTDGDGTNDKRETTSTYNRSVIIPEVIVKSSVRSISANQCKGAFTGVFGFTESQVPFDSSIMPFYTSTSGVDYYADFWPLLRSSAKARWSNLLYRMLPVGSVEPSTWVIDATSGYNTSTGTINGVFVGGTGVEFVNDGGRTWNSAYIGPEYNSEWFSMSYISGPLTKADMHTELPSMQKSDIYHPQVVKIKQGQRLKVWSGYFCKSTTNHADTALGKGKIWQRNETDLTECQNRSGSGWSQRPFEKLTRTWGYSELMAGVTPANLSETKNLKFGHEPGCSTTLKYDLQKIQE